MNESKATRTSGCGGARARRRPVGGADAGGHRSDAGCRGGSAACAEASRRGLPALARPPSRSLLFVVARRRAVGAGRRCPPRSTCAGARIGRVRPAAPSVEEVLAAQAHGGGRGAAGGAARRPRSSRSRRRLAGAVVVDRGRGRAGRCAARRRAPRRAGAARAARRACGRSTAPALVDAPGDARRARRACPIAGDRRVASSTSALGLHGARHRRRADRAACFVASEVARDWSDDEVAVVVAHELAHHAHRDLVADARARRRGARGAALCAAHAGRRRASGRGSAGAGDLAALPLVALVAGAVWLLATPLRHAQSRRQERRADALRAGADRAAPTRSARRSAASARVTWRRSGRRALTRWLYHRHPSVAERLALAERSQRGQAVGQQHADSIGSASC